MDIPRGITGVIHPPTDLKTLIDKTAVYVARNGKVFEAKIQEAEKNNLKFKFLEPDNPYNAYYLSRIDEFKKKIEEGEEINLNPVAAQSTSQQQNGTQPQAEKQPAKEEATLKAKAKAREDPAPKIYTVKVDSRMKPVELEIIKLTALFVAQHGKSFLSQIAQKERSNPQFEFLKGSHPRFKLFQQFLEAYTKVLVPPKGLLEQLKEDIESKNAILTLAQEAAEWETEESLRHRLKGSEDADRVNFHLIDWDNFIIVKTIDFPEEAPATGAAAPAVAAPPAPPALPPPPPPP
eukprot:Sspe_Gene.3204::Locus_1052_Transcript_2_2_Confidence_0.750_Length_967::g.3204::m.3204/K12825/SF3A1, SAP114; splicing factor 3A subunit 1